MTLTAIWRGKTGPAPAIARPPPGRSSLRLGFRRTPPPPPLDTEVDHHSGEADGIVHRLQGQHQLGRRAVRVRDDPLVVLRRRRRCTTGTTRGTFGSRRKSFAPLSMTTAPRRDRLGGERHRPRPSRPRCRQTERCPRPRTPPGSLLRPGLQSRRRATILVRNERARTVRRPTREAAIPQDAEHLLAHGAHPDDGDVILRHDLSFLVFHYSRPERLNVKQQPISHRPRLLRMCRLLQQQRP